MRYLLLLPFLAWQQSCWVDVDVFGRLWVCRFVEQIERAPDKVCIGGESGTEIWTRRSTP